MPYKRSRMSTTQRVLIGSAVTGSFALAVAGTVWGVSEFNEWRAHEAHKAACRADANRGNLPDDGVMREIPQRCWEVQ